MAYVPVPKDLSKVKTKVAFNLTKRQIVCFAAALLIGLPLFFLLKGSAGTNLAAMAMIVVMLPCFLLDGCPHLPPEELEKLKADMASSWHLEDKPLLFSPLMRYDRDKAAYTTPKPESQQPYKKGVLQLR